MRILILIEIKRTNGGLVRDYLQVRACINQQQVWHDNYRVCQQINHLKDNEFLTPNLIQLLNYTFPAHLLQCQSWEDYIAQFPGYPHCS